ncbi:MAG: hypothetical protein ACXVCV_10415 [Polyangia bacterium]
MRFRRLWLVGLLVAVAACSSRRHVEEPGFANGTRLGVRYDELAGTRVLRAFYDTARDEECAFQLLPDGAACLPQTALLDGWFADAACSEALVHIPRVAAGRSPPRALVTDAANACDGPPTVRALGDVVPPTQAYYLKSDGSCMQNPPNATIVLRRIGDEVPLDRFVHATPRVEPVSDLLGAVVLVADDGARFNLFANDQRHDEWTRSVAIGDGQSRWWPVHIAYNYGQGAPGTPGSVFADAACSRPTGIKDAHNALCPFTSVIEYVPGDACQQFTIRLHQAGAPVATADLHAIAGDGSCVPTAPSPNSPVELYVEMGDALPDDAFPTAAPVDVGDGRIVQRFDGTPDGSVAISARGELHDRARNGDCFVGLAADNQRRCLPGMQVDTVYFADAACTTPVVATSVAAGCATTPMLPPEVTYQGHAYPVGAPASPAMIYDKSADGCVLFGPPPSFDSWFALGPEIPASAFEPATLHTD